MLMICSVSTIWNTYFWFRLGCLLLLRGPYWFQFNVDQFRHGFRFFTMNGCPIIIHFSLCCMSTSNNYVCSVALLCNIFDYCNVSGDGVNPVLRSKLSSKYYDSIVILCNNDTLLYYLILMYITERENITCGDCGWECGSVWCGVWCMLCSIYISMYWHMRHSAILGDKVVAGIQLPLYLGFFPVFRPRNNFSSFFIIIFLLIPRWL